jgi:S1-C subfamily serine protease
MPEFDGEFSKGDLIAAIDDQPVKGTPDLFKILDRCQVGQTVTLTLLRDGGEVKAPLVLQERPQSTE